MNIIELTLEDLKRRNGIGWCYDTLQIGLYGCDYVSPACGKPGQPGSCYAAEQAARMVRMNPDSPYAGATVDGRWAGGVRVDYDRMTSAFARLPKRTSHDYFVTAMSDVFHKDVPDAFIEQAFLYMEANSHHVFKVLTKRIERVPGWFRTSRWGLNRLPWPRNVFIGTTVENARERRRIAHLLQVPAEVRFLSIEPLFEAIDLEAVPVAAGWPDDFNAHLDVLEGMVDPDDSRDPYWISPRIHQLIIGSQSDGNRPGPKETPIEAVRALRDHCVAAGTALYIKQLAIDGRLVTAPELDGRRWLQMPALTARSPSGSGSAG